MNSSAGAKINGSSSGSRKKKYRKCTITVCAAGLGPQPEQARSQLQAKRVPSGVWFGPLDTYRIKFTLKVCLRAFENR